MKLRLINSDIELKIGDKVTKLNFGDLDFNKSIAYIGNKDIGDICKGDRELYRDIRNKKIKSLEWKSRYDFDAGVSPKVKNINSNLFRSENSAPKSSNDLTLDNLGDLPSQFINRIKRLYKLRIMPPGPGVYMISEGLNKSQASKKYKLAVNKILTDLIEKGTLTLGDLKSEYRSWLIEKSNRSSKETDFDKLLNDIKGGKNKLPFIRIDNHWSYLMGKIGSTSAGFSKLKKSKNPDRYFLAPNGSGNYGYEWAEPKPINELPDVKVLIEGEFPDGERYKVMYLPEIRDYLSDYEDQTFYAYK